MFKYEGFEYSPEEVAEAAKEKDLTVDQYIDRYGLETVEVADEIQTVEVTEEIQTDPTEGKTSDVAVVDAAVTSEPDTASESTELESVDTSGELQQIDNSPQAIFKRRKQAALEQAAIDEFGEIELEEVVVTADDSNRKPEDLLDNIQKIDDKIKLLAGDNKDLKFIKPGEISALDSPKRLEEYNRLIGRRKQINQTLNEKLKKEGTVKALYRSLVKGDKALGEAILSVPSYAYELASLVSDPINRAFGFKETDLQKFEEKIGTRPLLDSLVEEQDALGALQQQYKDLNEIEGGIGENFKKGNVLDGFYLLGETLAESAPVSLSLMVGGAAGLSRAALTMAGGVPLAAGEMRTQLEEYPEETKGEMLLKSTIIGLSEGFFEGVFGAGAAGKVYKNLVAKEGVDAAKKTFKNGIISMYEGALQKYGVPLSMVGNGLEEVATQATQNVVNGESWNQGLTDSFLAGIGGGTLYGAPVNLSKGIKLGNETIQSIKTNVLLKPTEFKTISEAFAPTATTSQAQIKLSQSPSAEKVLVRQLKNDINKGNLTIDEANDIELNFRQTQGAVNNLKPLNLSEQDQGEVVELVKEKRNIEQTIKQVDDKALTEPQDQRVKEINELLRGYSARAKTAETAKVGQAISQLEKVGIQTLSTEEIQSYLQNNNLVENQEDAIKKSGEGAFIIQNPDTQEQEIIVNKDIGNISDPSHEALHALIFQTVRKSPDTAIKLGESLQEQLNKVDSNLIEDSGIRERLELYNQDPTAVQMEEVLTLFSDTVRNGTVKFNDSTFTKIGDFIRQFLSKLGVKAKFNNGRDVYNFIKDYNKSIESGKLTRGQVRAAKEGVEGELVTPAEQQADEQIIKESRSEDASNRVQEIYEEQGVAGTFDIIEQFKPITSRIVDRRSEAPGFDRQLLTDEIETGQRGIIDLIKEYKPESGVPLAAYINKFLPARAIEASKRVLGEEFTKDVSEATGIAAEEAVTETAVKPEAKAIDPFRIMPDVKETATAEVQKSIADKDVDVTDGYV